MKYKTGTNSIFIIVKNCPYYDAMHDFSDWLGTGSNPADDNRFRGHTGLK